jgi:hypothetical protein
VTIHLQPLLNADDQVDNCREELQSRREDLDHCVTEDAETGLRVRKAVYGRTEQETRAKLITALAARQDGTLVVGRGRVLTVRQYAERWLAGLRKRPTTRARYRQALAHVTGDDRLRNLPLTKLRPQHLKGLLAATTAAQRRR